MEPGLCRVYQHILEFDQNEFYWNEWPSLYRRMFADVAFMFTQAVPFGLKLAQPNEDGVTFLINPPGDQVIGPGDSVLVIAEDAEAYSPGTELHVVSPQEPPSFEEPEPTPSQILIMGYRASMAGMLQDLDGWVAKGSRIMLFCETPITLRMLELMEGGLDVERFENMTLDNREGNPICLNEVSELDCAKYNCTIILADQRDFGDGVFEDPLDTDSRTLVTSVIVRGLQREVHGMKARDKCTNVAEILDTRSQNLIKSSCLNDYVSNNDMVAMVLAQASINPEILNLMEECFKPDGSEMHIKDIRLYAHEGEALNWWELVARARQRAHVALGWKRNSIDALQNPVLNPIDKEQRIVWRYGDKLIVFSED